MEDTTIVTVKHISMTREVYHELLSALDELNEAYGKTAESINARRWLEYRWTIEQGVSQGVDVTSE